MLVITSIYYLVLSCFALPELLVYSSMYVNNFKNVYKNPESGTSKLYCMFIILLFILYRLLFVSFVTFSVNYSNNLLSSMQYIFVFFMSAWWMLILMGPGVAGIMTSVFGRGVGNNRLSISKRNSVEFKKMIFILPVYNESLELLIKGLDSIINNDYPGNLIEIHIAFDDGTLSELYINLVKNYMGSSYDNFLGNTIFHETDNGTNCYFHRWVHGGLNCSFKTYILNLIKINLI